MRSLGHRLRRELSAFELIVSVVLIVVLSVVVIHEAPALLADAEQAHMTATLNRARSGITPEALTRFVRGDLGALAPLEAGNPMEAMPAPPRNYIGELRSPRPEVIQGGAWYFDADASELVYRVEHEAGGARGGWSTRIDSTRRYPAPSAGFRVRLR